MQAGRGQSWSGVLPLTALAQVFVYRSLLVSPQLPLSASIEAHAWVTATEMPEYLSGERMAAVRPILL